MISFPAFCPACGLVFESGISVGDAQDVTLLDNRQTCPRCGAMAEIPDGTFNIVGDTIEVLAGSGLTRARMLKLQAILDQARSGDASPADAADAVVEEAPVLGPLMQRYRPRMGKVLIVFLGFVLQILISQGVSELRDDSATLSDVRQAVEQAVNQCRQR